MGNKLQRITSPKADAFTRIKQFTTGMPVELTADEEIILARWEAADEMMRRNELTTDEITQEIRTRFHVSRFTAMNDVRNAQKLFATARVVNKKYLGHLHLERINRDIEMARERLFWDENDDVPGVKIRRTPEPKELAALAKLEETYTYTLNSIPDEVEKTELPPPVFIFNLIAGQSVAPSMELEDAMREADEMIQSHVDEIDFEELPPNEDEGEDE